MISIGALCGSEFINRGFVAWLKEQPDYEARRQELGHTLIGMTKVASEQFEQFKLKFAAPTDRGVPYVMLPAMKGVNTPPWVVYFADSDMKALLDPLIAEIAAQIDAQLVPRFKVSLHFSVEIT